MIMHTVKVTFKPQPPFDYEFDGHANTPNHHVRHGEKIRWISASGDIIVDFTHGNPTDSTPPFYAPKDHYTTPVKLVGHYSEPAGTSYKYSVTINGVLDDPMIIFDDAGIETELQNLNVSAGSAQDLVNAVVGVLKAASGAGDPPQRTVPLFFPQGINLISVQVGVSPIGVTIKVAGPGVTGLEEA
jgi:hypothetical protein